jgi:hypothetical protein
MAAMAARTLGYDVRVLDPEKDCPARGVASVTITAPWSDAKAAAEVGVLQRRAHERGHARGGDADDRVLGADRRPPQPLLGLAGAVLGALDRVGQGVRSAGDDRHRQRRRDAERRDALGRVQGAQPTRRAGADVDHAPTGGQPLGHQLGGPGDLPRLTAHRLHGDRLLLHHQLDHLLGGQGVQQRGLRVQGLGGQRGIVDILLAGGRAGAGARHAGAAQVGGVPRLTAISTMASSSSP